MSYLIFDKDKLVNLEYSLNRESLRTNKSGAYSSTTLSGCNTRKYHGLLVVQLDELDGGKHVLLSSLDETIVQHDADFNLGIHKFPGDFYEPKGHKYLRNFEFDTIPKYTFRVGGVILTKTRLLVENEDTVIYQIVGDEEADLNHNKISVNSPIARALIGKEEGDEITVKAPSGDIEYEILTVSYV